MTQTTLKLTALFMLLLLVGMSQTLEAAPSATYTVTNTDDSGNGSLRWAITNANNNPGLDYIFFNIPGAGVHTISPLMQYQINDPVVIDGLTQPGTDCTSWPPTLRIEIEGSQINQGAPSGFFIYADDSAVSGLVMNRFAGTPIVVSSDNNIVSCNFLGTDSSGMSAMGNGTGISISTSNNNVLGLVLGDSVRGNVISGNIGNGIYFGQSDNNLIQANFIGTAVDGITPLGNGMNGIELTLGSETNRIGAVGVKSRNIISDNGQSGIAIRPAGATDTIIQNNYIGTDKTGMNVMSNGEAGITIEYGFNVLIGGNSAEKRNIIRGGIVITDNPATNKQHHIVGNYIGLAADGETVLGENGNAIFAGCGITLNTPDNFVGDGTEAGRNVIIGHENNVCVEGNEADNNQILGNYIGTDASGNGTIDLAGFAGITIYDADNTLIDGNLISGHSSSGVEIETVYDVEEILAESTTIINNQIGTNAAGLAAVPNGEGILVGSETDNTQIGGVQANEGNLIAGNGTGILLSGDGNATVQGNLIGTDKTGLVALGNQFDGISISGTNNLIGGNTATARNIIAGNGSFGIRSMTLFSGENTNNQIAGNYIGVDKTGLAALSNVGGGVFFMGESGGVIGGVSADYGNVISGNGGNGILIQARIPDSDIHAVTKNNVVAFNYIGLAADGTSILANLKNGIALGDLGLGDKEAVHNNQIHDNTISGNEEHGIYLITEYVHGNTITRNRIGTDATGASAVGNSGDGIHVAGTGATTISDNTIAYNGGNGFTAMTLAGAVPLQQQLVGNAIYDNFGMGIDLVNDGVSPNDLDDDDSKLPNDLQNFPVLTMAENEGADLHLVASLNSHGSTRYLIEFFFSESCDSSGHGEARIVLGSEVFITDSDGNVTIDLTLLDMALPQAGAVTATATDPDGNTSEFSQCLAVAGIPTAITLIRQPKVVAPMMTLPVVVIVLAMLLVTGILLRRGRVSLERVSLH